MTFSKSTFRPRAAAVALAISAFGLLAACDSQSTEYAYPHTVGKQVYTTANDNRSSVLGKNGLDIFGQSSRDADQGTGQGIGVNSFLWRASLDTVSFMPISSADPFGGVIITDWYSPPETPGERFKLNVFILGRALRADGVKIAAFRQVKDDTGAWTDKAVEPSVVTDLENTVLTRARKMRISAQNIANQ